MIDLILEEPSVYVSLPVPTPSTSPPMHVYGKAFDSDGMAKSLDPELITCCQELYRLTEILKRALTEGTVVSCYRYMMTMLSRISERNSELHNLYKGSGTIKECITPALYVFQTTTFYLPREMKIILVTASTQLQRAIQRLVPTAFAPEHIKNIHLGPLPRRTQSS
jgi:hypothetical protein